MTTRQARCADCQRLAPSSPDLPFFEDRGPGSDYGRRACHCGYYESAHRPGTACTCPTFTPVGSHDFDSFYCGCRGWD